MDKTPFFLLCSLAGLPVFSQTPEEASTQPNVLLIYTDDLGYADLSCYGAVVLSTPHIDRLAANGLRFTDCHATASTSTPSRYGLLTGAFPWRRKDTGVARGDAALIIDPETFTLPKLFQQAGYFTAAVGKWHLGLGERTGEQDWNKALPSHTPLSVGFQYSYIMAATADRVPCVYIRNGEVVDYDPDEPIYVSYEKPFEGEPLGRTHPQELSKLKYSHGHDMAIVNGISRIGYMKGGGKALWKDEEIAERIVQQSILVMDEAKRKGKPFFLYCATNDIHVPRYPAGAFRGKSHTGLRGDAVLQLDDTVGQLIRALEERGLLENTLLLFTSDNGPMLDDGYMDQAEELATANSPSGLLQGAKYAAYEGGTRVPMIVYWPAKIKKGQTRSGLMSQGDLFASFAELLQIKLPEGAAVDSRACAQKWWGKDSSGMEAVFTEGFLQQLSMITPEHQYIEAVKQKVKNPRVPWLPTYYDSGIRQRAQLLERHHSFQNPDVIEENAEKAAEMAQHLERVKQYYLRTHQPTQKQ